MAQDRPVLLWQSSIRNQPNPGKIQISQPFAHFAYNSPVGLNQANHSPRLADLRGPLYLRCMDQSSPETEPADDLSHQFAHVRHWVFDLDNTLYPPSVRLFDQIEQRMRRFVSRELGVDDTEADRLRRHYWLQYGTTLAGLMREHKIHPDAYLHEVHDISFDALTPDPTLAARIDALPGRKIIYTNGTAPYAAQVLAARGLSDVFDAIYGVEHAGFSPKPERDAFDTVFSRDGLNGEIGAMFEDDPRNLAVPHSLGMRTVHVAPEPVSATHIHHHTDDISAFLSRL